MKERTEQEILDKCKEIWPPEYKTQIHPPEFSVLVKNGVAEINVHKMYSAPGLGLKKLIALSEFFETQNINDSRFSYSGCDTCDYGSDYGFTLIIKPD